MPIKFTELLQQSWNFIRNQPKFSSFAISLLIVLQSINFIFLPNTAESLSPDVLFPRLLSAAATVFLSILIILNIKSINSGSFQQFFQNSGEALQRFFPVIFLTLVMVFPVSLGMAAGTLATTGDTSLSLIAFPLLIGGMFIFIKFSLVIFVYLTETPQKTVRETLAFTWSLTRGRLYPVVSYCFISQFLPIVINTLVLSLGANLVTVIISVVVSAFLSLYMNIFGFRFYQSYRQE